MQMKESRDQKNLKKVEYEYLWLFKELARLPLFYKQLL